MKKISLFISLILLLSIASWAQTIRRINNNPGVSGVNVYSTPQAAHDAAVAGDILYLEPSTTLYPILTVTKTLKIYGPGFYLDKAVNGPQNTTSAVIGGINFNNGSANSILSGVELNTTINIRDINITITRCLTKSITHTYMQVAAVYYKGNNSTIIGNFVQGTVTGSNSSNPDFQAGYNCLVSNNIIYGYVQTMTNTLINNNVLPYHIYTTNLLSNLFSCVITNNIIDARTVVTNPINIINGTSSTGNSASNNIVLGQNAVLGVGTSGSNNISNANANTTFLIANPWTNYTTIDNDFKLAPGSPAIGVGAGGIDAGAFGGNSPYIPSGMPAIPIITSFTGTAIGNSTTPLSITVGARSNN